MIGIQTSLTKKEVGMISMEKFGNRKRNSVGSSRIRVRWLLPHWPEAEEFVIGRDYKTLIFQKVYWDTMKENGDYKGIKILDIADPDWLEGRPVFEYIDWMDAVATSSPALRDYIKKLRPEKRVVCIPDRVALPEHEKDRRGKHEGRAQTIVWFGYSHNIHYLQKAYDDIIHQGLTLVVISEKPYTPPSGYRNMKYMNVAYSYDTVHKEIAKCDLAVMPSTDSDLKGKFKSNNKTLTCWALGVPVVSSGLDVLERLMDPDERNKEMKKRIKEVEEKYDVKQSVRNYRDLINEIKAEKA